MAGIRSHIPDFLLTGLALCVKLYLTITLSSWIGYSDPIVKPKTRYDYENCPNHRRNRPFIDDFYPPPLLFILVIF